MANKIRLGDTVIVITGKDKGKYGLVTKMLLSKNRLIISGINLFKKHFNDIPDLKILGCIILKEAPIHISNVAIYNTKTGKADKIRFKRVNNKKIRIFKSDNSII